MQKIHAAITAVGGYVPDYVMTNKELETIVDTTDEWITTRTGIKERRLLKGEGKGSSDLAVGALENLFSKRPDLKKEDIELLICATTTPDFQFPATANVITDKFGLVNAFGYDINAACSGFLFALNTAAQFIETGRYKKVIVVGGSEWNEIVKLVPKTEEGFNFLSGGDLSVDSIFELFYILGVEVEYED